MDGSAFRSLLSEWASHRRLRERDALTWIGSLPRLCEALCAVDALGQRCATLLLQDRWGVLREKMEETVRLDSPSLRDQAVAALAKPILGILESAEIIGAETLRDEAVAFCRAEGNELLFPCLVQVLRRASGRVTPEKRASPGLDAIRRHCIRWLKASLASPARDEDDWSIDLPEDCRCELCATLRGFLSDPAKRQLEWPLAKQGRLHVHRRLDTYELPVRHATRRTGRPYTLVLTKTTTLFEHEARERRSWQSDLDWLTRLRSARG